MSNMNSLSQAGDATHRSEQNKHSHRVTLSGSQLPISSCGADVVTRIWGRDRRSHGKWGVIFHQLALFAPLLNPKTNLTDRVIKIKEIEVSH